MMRPYKDAFIVEAILQEICKKVYDIEASLHKKDSEAANLRRGVNNDRLRFCSLICSLSLLRAAFSFAQAPQLPEHTLLLLAYTQAAAPGSSSWRYAATEVSNCRISASSM